MMLFAMNTMLFQISTFYPVFNVTLLTAKDRQARTEKETEGFVKDTDCHTVEGDHHGVLLFCPVGPGHSACARIRLWTRRTTESNPHGTSTP
jgi:hypothetical protein